MMSNTPLKESFELERTMPLEDTSEGGPLALLVIGERISTTYRLPPRGSLTIGREEGVDVVIRERSISRRHARLHVDSELRIEDLGSANGTSVRESRLAPGQLVSIAIGEAIKLGPSTLVVQRISPPPTARKLWEHRYFEARLAEECARAERLGGHFVVARVHAEGAQRADVERVLMGAVRPDDAVGACGIQDFELLLCDLGLEKGKTVLKTICAQLSSLGGTVTHGLSCFPDDGREPSFLLAAAAARLRQSVDDKKAFGSVIVRDPKMQELYRMLEKVAKGSINVLLLGETGVGKEVMAEQLHKRSPRAGRPLLKLNCAALSEGLLESELFGQERGSFTDAVSKSGLLELADGGSIFLDEVGELPLALQAKLLRVLEDGQVRRVGGLKWQPFDVRFISATNRNLEDEIAKGRFRQDLYFRLNGASIVIPPLRDRQEEIEELARAFLADACQRAGQSPMLGLPAPTLELFKNYRWPGNVRELRNAVERAVLLCAGPSILSEHLPPAIVHSPPPPVRVVATPPSTFVPDAPAGLPKGGSLQDTLAAVEKERIIAALEQCGYNQSRAAKMLGISRNTLIARLNAYNLSRPRMPKDVG